MPPATLYHHPSTIPLSTRTTPTDLASFTAPLVPAFSPTPYLFNGHLQTIFSTITPRVDPFPLHYLRRHHTNPLDGGHFAVDFVTSSTFPSAGTDDLPSRTRNMSVEEAAAQDAPTEDDTPIVIALHGLTGGSHELYLRAALAPLVARGWIACVVNARGCALSRITSPQLFNAKFTGDLRLMVKMFRRLHPNRPVCCVGFSLGANILTNYLGEEGIESEITAAVVVSNPWNLLLADAAMQRTMIGHHVYSKALGGNLRELFVRHREELVKHPRVAGAKAENMVTPADFDREVTAKVFGYETVYQYYRAASSCDNLLKVRTPLLVLQSQDDPVVGTEPIPYEEVGVNPWVVMAVTQGGGHLGWFEGWRGERWFPKPVMGFLEGFARGDVRVDRMKREDADSAVEA